MYLNVTDPQFHPCYQMTEKFISQKNAFSSCIEVATAIEHSIAK